MLRIIGPAHNTGNDTFHVYSNKPPREKVKFLQKMHFLASNSLPLQLAVEMFTQTNAVA